MIGRGDADGVDIFILEKLAKIAVRFDWLVPVFELAGLPIEHFLIDITQGNDAHPRNASIRFDVRLAPAVKTNDRDPDVPIGARNLAPASRSERESAGAP